MIWLRQSTAVVVSFGPAVLFSDGVTLVTNLVGTGANKTEDTSNGITLSKNGGAFAVRHATAGTSTYDSISGCYRVPLDTTDTGTLGALRMNYVNAAAFCPLFMDMMVVPAAVWDTYFAASGGVAFPTSGTLPNSTLTAAQIATGVWQDTTAGDFTTALSVGKSVMNGVSLGTGLTVNDLTTKTGFALTSGERTSIADAMLDEANGVETAWTVRKVLRIAFAVLGGKASGMGTATGVFRAGDDSKDRVTATQDASGNRTAVTLDAT